MAEKASPDAPLNCAAAPWKMEFPKSVPCPHSVFVLLESATPTGNPQEALRIRRNQPLHSMAAGFVFYPAAAGGCRHCLPDEGKQTSVGVWGSAKRSGASPSEAGNARPSIRKESCGFADLGRSN